MKKAKKINWNSQGGTILLDALRNCHDDEIGTDDSKIKYATGLLVGVVSALMYAGFYFDEAWEQILRRVKIQVQVPPMDWPTLADYDAREEISL